MPRGLLKEIIDFSKYLSETKKEKQKTNRAKERARADKKTKSEITADLDTAFETLRIRRKRPLWEIFQGLAKPGLLKTEFESNEVVKFTSGGSGFKMRLKWRPHLLMVNIQFKGKTSTSGMISRIVINHLEKVHADGLKKKKRKKPRQVAKPELEKREYRGQSTQDDDWGVWGRDIR